MRWRLLAVAVAMAVTALAVGNFVWMPACGEEVISDQRSPDGTAAFALHRRNCGATTEYVTALSIRSGADAFDPSERNDVLVISGDVPVAASWIDSGTLEVQVPKGADIFRREAQWNGVAIIYLSQ